MRRGYVTNVPTNKAASQMLKGIRAKERSVREKYSIGSVDFQCRIPPPPHPSCLNGEPAYFKEMSIPRYQVGIATHFPSNSLQHSSGAFGSLISTSYRSHVSVSRPAKIPLGWRHPRSLGSPTLKSGNEVSWEGTTNPYNKTWIGYLGFSP